MAKNKRVALTLSSEVYEVLAEIAHLTNKPKTAIVTEILVSSLPIFKQVAVAIKQAREGQNQLAIDTAVKFLQDASNTVNQAQIDLTYIEVKYANT